MPSAKPKTGNDEWYTSRKIVDACRKTLGGIDLDPASCELANKTVGAKIFYTKEQNGLQFPWTGRVFMNPPYSVRGGRAEFISKLVESWLSGEVEAACLVCPSDISYGWAKLIHEHVVAICSVVLPNRQTFYGPDPRATIPGSGTGVYYFGPSPRKFSREIRRAGVGYVYYPCSESRKLLSEVNELF